MKTKPFLNGMIIILIIIAYSTQANFITENRTYQEELLFGFDGLFLMVCLLINYLLSIVVDVSMQPRKITSMINFIIKVGTLYLYSIVLNNQVSKIRVYNLEVTGVDIQNQIWVDMQYIHRIIIICCFTSIICEGYKLIVNINLSNKSNVNSSIDS